MSLMKATVLLILLALAAGVVILLAGCGHPLPPAPAIQPKAAVVGTPELVRDQKTKLAEIQPKIIRLGELVTGLTVANLDNQRSAVLDLIGSQARPVGLFADFQALNATTGATEKSVASDVDTHNALIQTDAGKDKKIAALEESDPVRGWFRIIGGILVAAGVALVVLSFLPWTLWASPFRWVAISATIVGFALLTIATFMRLTEMVIGITMGIAFLNGVVWLAYYVWEHRKTLSIATGIVTSIQDAKAKTLGDPMGVMVNMYNVKQPPNVKAFVDSVQATINGPGNVAKG